MQTIGEEKKVGKRIVIASRLKRLSTFALSPSLGTIFFFFLQIKDLSTPTYFFQSLFLLLDLPSSLKSLYFPPLCLFKWLLKVQVMGLLFHDQLTIRRERERER
jgi:hypothetical protein